MTRQEQVHINTAYASVKSAMDELAQVRDKDSHLTRIQNTLYQMEDILYQYISTPREGG